MANIVIVGANQGIGYHMAKRLLELNHSVVVLDIDISNIRQLQPRYPETLLPIVVDARRLSDIENGVKQAAGRFGSIDIAIHNACRCTFMSEPDSDYDVYRDVMDVNFFGALRLAKTVLPYMREQKEGRIIFNEILAKKSAKYVKKHHPNTTVKCFKGKFHCENALFNPEIMIVELDKIFDK